MRTISTLLTLIPFALIAQTTWNVEAGGTLSNPNNLPYYDPMEVIIDVGDIVLWTNVAGTHNVSGELNLFPNNPEGFGNGQPAGAPWTFSYTFTLPGVYGYHCTQTFQGQSHSTTQHGMITVVEGQSVEERTDLDALILFPVPADDHITVELPGRLLTQAEVIGVDGRSISVTPISGVRFSLDVATLPKGVYVLRLRDREGVVGQHRFLKS